MTLPAKLIIQNSNDQVFEWGAIQDGLAAANNSQVVIPDAVVTATLYKNRVIGDPLRPGTIVTSFGTAGTLTLTYANSGLYRGNISDSFSDVPGTNYVVRVVANTPGGAHAEWEIKVQVVTRTTQ